MQRKRLCRIYKRLGIFMVNQIAQGIRKELCRFNLKENGSTVTSVIFSELYKQNGEWQFKAIGEGKIADLNGILGIYM